MFGLLWPNQAGPVGTMLLAPPAVDGEDRNYALIRLRPKGRDPLLLRGGPDATILQQTRVVLIGVGAVGSHVAE